MSTTEGHIIISHDVVEMKNGHQLLRVHCSGVYALGCSGAPQARKIYDESASLVRLTQCRYALLDFRELEYRWGDNMWWPLQLDHHPLIRDILIKFAVVLGDKNRKAMISLIEDDGGCEPWQSIGFVFDSEDEAVRYLEAQPIQISEVNKQVEK